MYCFITLRKGSPEHRNLRNSLDWFIWEEVSIQREWVSLKEGGKLCERVAGLSEWGYPVNGRYVSVKGLSLLRGLPKGLGSLNVPIKYDCLNIIRIITVRVGYVFTGACHSLCPSRLDTKCIMGYVTWSGEGEVVWSGRM